jgi:hypothetical protein
MAEPSERENEHWRLKMRKYSSSPLTTDLILSSLEEIN